MKGVMLAAVSVVALGCVTSSPTIIISLSGNVSECARPTCVYVQAESGNLAGQASTLLVAALQQHGIAPSQSCPASDPYVRVEVHSDDVVMTTHGVMPGQLSLEATLQVGGSGGPGARVWFLRTNVYYLTPEVDALSEAISYVLLHGAVPTKGVLVR